ncbi:uncharacterized protein N7479_009589 [Penicillium vulpinum]|uniref:Uncharacterized protein n=1 Tax=Penicillium vulpinum TaxID=29845 RepID=A0A1V6RZB7_9EURO|nr:uncharacterized protein N7479_009589 [Penicillium vulpinum]KAJ5951176.1 hypothetical protein N7479_009589 [Penicillium vulpinum]OQE06824.1 hypothetical protein PENVUL_c016G00986 [Penicillium vulpinum]
MQFKPSGRRLPSTSQPRPPKRRRNEEDDDDSSPSPTRRRLSSNAPESSDSENDSESSDSENDSESSEGPPPYPIQQYSSPSSDGNRIKTPSSPVSDLPPVSEEQVYEYYRQGSRFQAWIADPSIAGCRYARATSTLFDMFNNDNDRERFTCPRNHFDDPPSNIQEDVSQLGLPITGNRHRFTELVLHGFDADGCKRESEYQHSIAEGVMIGEAIYRWTGPHWSDIAVAQYKFDHDIDTLKYIYFTNVQNEETLPYLEDILYPRYGIEWPTSGEMQWRAWGYETDEYREILGTRLGKSAACFVLGAWERGTRRIARIHTFGSHYQIHLRFDIEPFQEE